MDITFLKDNNYIKHFQLFSTNTSGTSETSKNAHMSILKVTQKTFEKDLFYKYFKLVLINRVFSRIVAEQKPELQSMGYSVAL